MLKASDVDSAEKFAEYTQMYTGTPYPTKTNMGLLKKRIKEFFEQYPHTSFETLCKIVDWSKTNKRRFGDTHKLVSCWRYAWEDGFLPELDPDFIQKNEIREITEYMLQNCDNEELLDRFIRASDEWKISIYEEWAQS